MRILQLIGSLNFGGAEDVLVKLATGLTADGHDVHVCATLGLGPLADRLRDRGITVERTGPNGRLHNYLRPWHVHAAIRRFQPEVVHTHGLPPLAEMSQVAAIHLGPRWVHTFHFGNYPHTEKRRHMHVERVGATAPDALVAVSERQRDQLIRYHRIAPARIRTILNGVESNPFIADGTTRRRKRAELGIADDAWVVGSIAVLTEQKGMRYLLQAARDIVAARPDARIVIVGGGPLEASLRAEAAALGLGDSVIFTSWRADALELLAAFDVYVMASLWEAMPIALLEAMAAARAIVVTDVGQNARIVEPDVSAVMIPKADASAIAGAVNMLAGDPARAEALGRAAAARVTTHFSTATMVREYEALYAAMRRTSFRQAKMAARLARW